jgi:hypothetical protein
MSLRCIPVGRFLLYCTIMLLNSYLPGWTMTISEVSNGVYRVLVRDRQGRSVELTDADLELATAKAQGDAFLIEKQISSNWSRFLFELSVLLLQDLHVEKAYQEMHFGSWTIEWRKMRLLYDGKDSWLILQQRENDIWDDKLITTKDDLTLETLLNLIKKIRL